MNIPIVYEDEWIMVVDKPAGLLVIPTPKNEQRTLTSILNEDLKEKEIVFYADKRVTHNKIVDIEERISDLLIRYGKTEQIRQRILKNKESILETEKKINSMMIKDINIVISSLK